MTATEVLERKQEFMRVIGPTFGRLESSYVGPMVDRVFAIMMRGGAFAEAPEPLQGRSVKFEYESPVAKAQKQIEIAAAVRTAEILGPYVAANPMILDNFDGDRIARDVGEISGMPHRWLKAPDRVAEERQGRAAAQAMAQMSLADTPLAGADQGGPEG